MTYRGQQEREQMLGEVAGAFADAMALADDKDRVALLQSKIEAIVAGKLDLIYPTLEGAKKVAVGITMASMKEPDSDRLQQWLTDIGIDPAWMKVAPFTVDYEAQTVAYETYLHTPNGTIVRGNDQQPRSVHRIHHCKEMPVLPELEHTVVEVIA